MRGAAVSADARSGRFLTAWAVASDLAPIFGRDLGCVAEGRGLLAPRLALRLGLRLTPFSCLDPLSC